MEPLEILVLIAAGAAIGVYATAVGAGGGFLFAPLLLWRHADAAPAEIALASMCLVLASSGFSTFRMARAKRIDFGAVGMIAVVAVPAALIGALGTASLPREVFAIGFAAILAGLAAYLVWRPSGDAGTLGRRGWRRLLRDREGDRYIYWIPVRRTLLATGAVGMFTALAGIGGGPFFSLIAVRIMRMPVWLGVPASYAIVAVIAAVVIIFHTAGQQWGEPLEDVPPLLVGALLANPLGLRVAAVANERGLTRLLAAALLIVAVFTAVQAV